MSLINVRPCLCSALLCVFALSFSSLSHAQVSIVQPGAPGQDTRELSADEAIQIADNTYSADDVAFMLGMIPHHQQALEMAKLVSERTNRPELVDIAGRIEASQSDEMAFMQGWLEERGEAAGDAMAHHAHAAHDMPKMDGMASPAQMAELAASKGTDFDRLFLELMIRHHEGAITMVDDLLKQPGSAYDPVLLDFTSDIKNDQNAEIERMHAILRSLSTDPRATLSAGFRNAGEAILNLSLVDSRPKPAGFYDPANPAGLPLSRLKELLAEENGEEAAEEILNDTNEEEAARAPLLSFANTDMAFSGNTLIAGNYHGFNIYKLANEGVPALFSSVVCPGGQGDVSIVGDLLIMSQQETRGRLDCGLQGINEDVSEERFRGLRIFDISDLSRPRQVGAVQTCRGSHTHSVVSGPGKDGKIIVFNSGTSSVRPEEELAGCIDIPGDSRNALFRIDVIEIPVDDPSKARIVNSPAVFADEESGELAGLWRGGDHGDDTQKTRITDQCHDITVFPSKNLAAGACSGNGIIFDIRDPANPKRLDVVTDKGFAYWHSATFNNDGTKVIFTDEWGGGQRPRCRAWDPLDWGADAIYDIVDGTLQYRSHYKMPAPQSEQENCVAHNGSIIPVPGRDIFVQAWYQGGISVVDFTDSAKPREIAYFDRGAIDAEEAILGGYWSSYWYQGRIYATEMARGLDIFALEPSDYLSENEIAAAALAEEGDVFNPQHQFPVSWPAVPVVARAYVDQLQRAGALDDDFERRLSVALNQAEAALDSGKSIRGVADELRNLARELRKTKMADSAKLQKAGLADTLTGMAKNLQG